MSDDVTRLRHWQIKDFPEDKRRAVAAAAMAAGKTVAEWLEPVIDAALGAGVNLSVNAVWNGTERQQRFAEARALADIVAELAQAGADKSIRQAANRPLRETLQLCRPALPAPAQDHT